MRELILLHLIAMASLAVWLVAYVALFKVFPRRFVLLAGGCVTGLATTLGLHLGWSVPVLAQLAIGAGMVGLYSLDVLMDEIVGWQVAHMPPSASRHPRTRRSRFGLNLARLRALTAIGAHRSQ